MSDIWRRFSIRFYDRAYFKPAKLRRKRRLLLYNKSCISSGTFYSAALLQLMKRPVLGAQIRLK